MVLRGKNSSIELRDIHESDHRKILLEGGGKSQVPCLRIDRESEDKEVETIWLYESDDIINFIKKHNLID